MGVYDNTLIATTDQSERISSLTEYLNNLTGISAEEYTLEYDSNEWNGAKFTIDGTEIEGFFGYRSDTGIYKPIVYLKNGEVDLIPPTSNEYDINKNLSVYSYIDSKAKMISIKDLYTGHSGIEILYVNTKNGSNLIGYKVMSSVDSDNVKYVDISTLTFEEVTDTSRIAHTYANMFPYTAIAGTIDFLGQAYFKNGNGLKRFETDILRECSTVTLMSTASLSDGNWIALGAHCLAPLDEEVNE